MKMKSRKRNNIATSLLLVFNLISQQIDNIIIILAFSQNNWMAHSLASKLNNLKSHRFKKPTCSNY